MFFEYFPVCLSTPRTLCDTLWLNHRITEDFLKAAATQASWKRVDLKCFSVTGKGRWLDKDTFLPLKWSFIQNYAAVIHFSIFCTFLIWLLRFNSQSTCQIIKPTHIIYVVIEQCLDCNAAYTVYIHSNSNISFMALTNLLLLILFNNAVVLHAVLCLLCFFNVSMY